MSEQEKLTILEEIMELDEGTLAKDDLLENYDEWDSLTAISLIAIIDEKFGKTLTGNDIKSYKTVADVLSVMV